MIKKIENIKLTLIKIFWSGFFSNKTDFLNTMFRINDKKWQKSSKIKFVRNIYSQVVQTKRIEKYREELSRKKCKTPISLYCFQTAGVLHTFVLYNLLGPGTSFNKKKILNLF